MAIKIYHNPRCSKSRQALQLLQDKGIQVEVIEYLKNPPSTTELDHILQILELEPKQIVRSKEEEYKKLGLDQKNFSRKEYIDILVKHPVLIERPIVVNGNRAAIGRPPENILKVIK